MTQWIRVFAGILQPLETSGKLLCLFSTAEVRGSNPLSSTIKWTKKALVGDAQHQDGDVVTGGLLLEVQHGVLYTAGNDRSVESD